MCTRNLVVLKIATICQFSQQTTRFVSSSIEKKRITELFLALYCHGYTHNSNSVVKYRHREGIELVFCICKKKELLVLSSKFSFC